MAWPWLASVPVIPESDFWLLEELGCLELPLEDMDSDDAVELRLVGRWWCRVRLDPGDDIRELGMYVVNRGAPVEVWPSRRRSASSFKVPFPFRRSLLGNAESSEICGSGIDRVDWASRLSLVAVPSNIENDEGVLTGVGRPRVEPENDFASSDKCFFLILPFASISTTVNVASFELEEFRLGVVGLDIHIPSTSIPLWMARTPNGISLLFLFVGDRPIFRISVRRVLFSSSMISCFCTFLFDNHNLIRPMAKTMTMAHASTW